MSESRQEIEAMMPKTVRAIYSNGELQLLEPVDFVEGQVVSFYVIRDPDVQSTFPGGSPKASDPVAPKVDAEIEDGGAVSG